MNTEILSEFIVCAAKIIANGLKCYVETVSDKVHGAVRQTVFELAEIVE